jgi:hypothetical protein
MLKILELDVDLDVYLDLYNVELELDFVEWEVKKMLFIENVLLLEKQYKFFWRKKKRKRKNKKKPIIFLINHLRSYPHSPNPKK